VTEGVVSGTRAPPGGAGGEGFYAGSGSTLTVSHAVVDNNQEIGIYALDSGTVATVSDVVVNATLFARNGNFGRGLDCGHGARMTVTRALVSNNHDASIVADGAGTMLSVADSVVRNAQPVPGLGAWGLSVGNGASLQADRMYIDHVAGTGMAAVGAGTVLTVNDSVLHDVSMASVTQVGFGVAVQAGGLFTAERVLIDSATQVGVFAYLAGNLEIFDSVVAHTRARATANVGIGAFGGTLTVARSVIDSNFGAGIQTVGMSSGTVEDSCVRGTQPVGGVLGFGLTLESGGTLTASRTLVTSNSDLGVHAYGAGATASLTDVIVAHTQPTMIGFGGGVEANGAAIDVHRVAVIDVAGFGLASATRQANNTDPIMTSTLTGSDVYVSRVGNSTIRVNETGYMPDGASVSYALHAGTGCVLDLQRATADSAGFGVYNAGGMLHVRTGVIASMLDAAGAVPTSAVAAMTQLDAIGFVGNAQDQVVVLDGLPEASEITAPAPVCPPGGCM
jgi:hypothetical protein